jgi:tetratricopeptide (TPR) repeat protein
MSAAFIRWIESLTSYELRRAAGNVPNPWAELESLTLGANRLAADGIDYFAAAKALTDLARAALFFEQRGYEDALGILYRFSCPTIISGFVARLAKANCAILIGNVHLVRDENYELASEYFERAVSESSVPEIPMICGNAAINRGICQALLGRGEDAISSYTLALEKYSACNNKEKRAIALHSLGNAYRSIGQVERGIGLLHEAVTLSMEADNTNSSWQVSDDLARAYLTMASDRPGEADQWISLASKASDVATICATKMWNTIGEDEGRLADLSEQLVNHAITRCDIAAMGDHSAVSLLGTFAIMKGRIRRSSMAIPPECIARQDPSTQTAIASGIPEAHFCLIADAVERLANHQTIALVDQFAISGGLLRMGYMVFGGSTKALGGCDGEFEVTSLGNPVVALRSRDRGKEIHAEYLSLINAIEKHGQRCEMVVPAAPESPDQATRDQLAEWSSELSPSLAKLGSAFFPDHLLADLRQLNVDHVVLCVDPLFPRLPYLALIGPNGPIIEEPWTLSVITTSSELPRILMRRQTREANPADLCWLGPDNRVNADCGGEEEVSNLRRLASVSEFRGKSATLEKMSTLLSEGRWCHFRGHGRWTGSSKNSGVVLADGETFCSAAYRKLSDSAAFMFTAACHTGFGETVGSELFGSLVDYDYAGLLGGVFTSWPIHGIAATLTTRLFYEELHRSENAAVALKFACQETRRHLPHPYFWAPFCLVGGWDVSNIIQWRK